MTKHGRTLAVSPKSTRQISPGTGLGISLFHHVQHVKVFVGTTIAIVKQARLFLQVEDRGREAATFFPGELGKFSKNFGRAHEGSI
jgi:hypothetical protein